MRLTVGPLPPAVYWRRRAVVLGGILIIILMMFYIFGNAGEAPAGTDPSAQSGVTPGPTQTVLTPIIPDVEETQTTVPTDAPATSAYRLPSADPTAGVPADHGS